MMLLYLPSLMIFKIPKAFNRLISYLLINFCFSFLPEQTSKPQPEASVNKKDLNKNICFLFCSRMTFARLSLSGSLSFRFRLKLPVVKRFPCINLQDNWFCAGFVFLHLRLKSYFYFLPPPSRITSPPVDVICTTVTAKSAHNINNSYKIPRPIFS